MEMHLPTIDFQRSVSFWDGKFERTVDFLVDLCDEIQPTIESYVESSDGIYTAMDCLSSRIRIP